MQDYDITDRQWTPLGDTAMILFQTGNLGHIHISLKEPLKEDTAVVLYFQENPDSQFDRFRRICRYMMRGTREADLTVLPGPWQSFRLEIRGDFSPEKITLIPAADPSSVSAATIFKQMRLLQTVVFCLFCASGMYLWFGCRKTAAQTRKNNRILWLDMLRTLAAVFVIVLHVIEPIMPLLPAGSALYPLTQAASMISFTCNVLFIFISGALLLPYRQESVQAFIKKRMAGVVLPLMLYAVFYTRLTCISLVPERARLFHYLGALLRGAVPEAPHLWLVYEIIGLYLAVIPFRNLLKELPERLEKYLALVILLLLGARTVSAYIGQPFGIHSFFGGWPGIFLLGYLFTRNWMRRFDGLLVVAGVFSFVLSFWLSGLRADYKSFVCNQSLLMVSMTMALAAWAMRMDPWLKPLKQLLSLCSRYSYSVLLIHWYVLNTFIYSGWLSSGLSASLQILLPILACLVISLSLSVITDRLVTDVVKSIGGRLLPHRASGSPPPR